MPRNRRGSGSAQKSRTVPDARRSRASTVVIPLWMDKSAPGAAEAARTIAAGPLSASQRERLQRLTSDATRSAWLEPLRRRNKSKEAFSENELWNAHHELMVEAHRAPEFRPIGNSEIQQSIEKLVGLGNAIEGASREMRKICNDAQLIGLWGVYRNRLRKEGSLEALPDQLPSVVDALDQVAEFFQRAGERYKPQGPVPLVGHPRDRDALKTTVIRQIAQTCQKHFGAVLHSTVATLANAALARTDIDRNSVAGSLRRSPRTVHQK
jgi:hypothetical protein